MSEPPTEQIAALKEREISPSSIAVATSTLYKNWYDGPLQSTDDTDKIRGDLALETIKKAKAKGFQVVVVDGAVPPLL